MLRSLRPNNQQGGNTTPSISRQVAKSHPKPIATSKYTPLHSPAHQRDKTQLHPAVGRHQSLPPRSLHKPPEQSHPPGEDTRSKRGCSTAACGKEATNPEKQNEVAEKYIPDEGTR